MVSIWTICRVWNTTALLCACNWDTETGQQEEEYLTLSDIASDNVPTNQTTGGFNIKNFSLNQVILVLESYQVCANTITSIISMVERVIEFGDDSTSQDNKNIEKNVPHMILIFFHYCKVS